MEIRPLGGAIFFDKNVKVSGTPGSLDRESLILIIIMALLKNEEHRNHHEPSEPVYPIDARDLKEPA